MMSSCGEPFRLSALLDANWKLIYREKAKDVGMNRVELYGRRTDRGDSENVAARNPREMDQMMAAIGKWMDSQRQIRRGLGQCTKAAMDQQTLDPLRSLRGRIVARAILGIRPSRSRLPAAPSGGLVP